MKRSGLAVALILLGACHTIGIKSSRDAYAEISPAVADEMLLDTNQVVIIDVRPASEYQSPAGHIPGAINAPFEIIEKKLPELLPYRKDTVLVYGNSDPDGAVAAKLLTAAGFKNIVHLQGGIRGWISAGFHTVSSR